MKPLQFMVIAGEPSGDLLAAELAESLRSAIAQRGGPPPVFFGAGGPRMADAGVELELDLTRFAIIGLADVLRNLVRLRSILDRMLHLARTRKPDVIVCVDYGGFNRRFAAALRSRPDPTWTPRLVQYVSPQVWASRPSRARTLARDLDLLISILPIEQPWYRQRYPDFRVEFVGHPIVDRHPAAATHQPPCDDPPRVVLLPGSRPSEISRHWPPMVQAAELVSASTPTRWIAVFPSKELQAEALRLRDARAIGLTTRVGGLSDELSHATVAIASTGTVTLECALWTVPTVAIYRASWSTYQIARRIIRVRHLALPNLLSPEPVMPELLQDRASPTAIADATRKLLADSGERDRVRRLLRQVVTSLGAPGASQRAAESILSLLPAR